MLSKIRKRHSDILTTKCDSGRYKKYQENQETALEYLRKDPMEEGLWADQMRLNEITQAHPVVSGQCDKSAGQLRTSRRVQKIMKRRICDD